MQSEDSKIVLQTRQQYKEPHPKVFYSEGHSYCHSYLEALRLMLENDLLSELGALFRLEQLAIDHGQKNIRATAVQIAALLLSDKHFAKLSADQVTQLLTVLELGLEDTSTTVRLHAINATVRLVEIYRQNGLGLNDQIKKLIPALCLCR